MSSKKPTAAEQKRYVEQLQQLTHATATDAARILKSSKWDLNVAVDAFFQDYTAQENASARGGEGAKKEARDQKLKAIFKQYEDPKSPGQITVQTISDYFEAIGIEDMDTDVAVYIVSYELKSQSLGDLELKTFCEGWGDLKIDSVRGMANQVPLLKKKFLSEPDYFKKVYKYVFELGKEDGAKVVVRDMAVAFWQCLLPPVLASSPSAIPYSTPNGTPGMGARELVWWTEFLEEKGVKGVSKDLWYLFIEYMAKVPNTFDEYDDDGAWPSVLDDFTEHAKKRRTKEGGMDLS